ncbi:MAG: carbohydrate ABC transporter permease [Chloroflexi bacterium]|nr:carbohydrate ABC transporter permease [Chloroflexota bacterium]
MLAPFAWMVSTALKETGREFTFPPEFLPNPVVWRNYPEALTLMPFPLFLGNTLTIAITAMAGVLLTSSMVAFGFARLHFPGRSFLFGLLLSTMMLPGIVTLIPQFILFKTLGWYDTFLPLIVPYWFGGGAVNVFLIRQFFMTIPLELDEAARIDGASNLTIYWRIMLPLSGPVLATVGVLGFLYMWNDFLHPLIYITSMEKRTLALGIVGFKGLYSTMWNLMMAASSVMVIPVIILFFAAQRYFVRGVVLTGLAGR